MATRHWAWTGALVLSLVGPGAAAAEGKAKKLVVVELFTSQGCSSCPPADANLITLAARPDVLALSFSVTYWDRLGWKDTFGQPAFTERQYEYEPALGERGPFTPQMVIQGRISRVGHRLSDVEAAIAAVPAPEGPDIALSEKTISIGPGKRAGAPADIWLVAYDPGIVNVPIRRGENSGRTLSHGRVVHRLARIGAWDGRAISLARPSAPGLKTAILVQAPEGGPILAAATD